ncbi:hypothetical protein KC726_05145 [Candidatus Woesebacteria bacterium]|nr:hypothetical protein [Candidatus Woesebacteria bacterium]
MNHNQLAAKEETIVEEAEKATNELELKYKELELKEKSEFLNFRKQWSSYLLILVVFLTIFYAFFLWAIGAGWITIKDEWTLRIIIVSGFGQILALAKIVVDFLFKKK